MTVTSFAGKSNGHLLFRRKKKNIGWGEYIVLAYEIKAIPDLTLSKYQVFEDSGIEGMIDAQTQFIRQLYRAAILGDVNIHFLFDYDPDRPEGNKLNIRLLFTSSKENEEYFTKMRKLVKASGISNYFNFTEIQEQKITSAIYTHQCFMRKKERILETSVNNEKTYFYVVPNWKIRDHCRLYNIFKLMESFNEPCCYRVDLFVQKELEEKIHKSFENPLTYLRNSYTSKTGISEYSRMHNEKKDPNVNEVLKQYEDWLKAIDTSPSFLGRICSFSNDEQYSKLLIDSAISECLETGNGNLLEKIGNFSGMEDLNDTPPREESCSKETPGSMKEWPITFTLEEASAFTRLPVLYDGENIELSKETTAIHIDSGFSLGKDANEYSVKIPFDMLPKHMFVCGVPGAGKTNTMLHIANNLWNHKLVREDGTEEKTHIPFLVLEPAKREYRELALFDIPELIIFSPSANTNFPLRINPFEFPKGLTLSEHIGKLCQVFEGAFPIPAPAPFILDRAIQAVYEKHGWNERDINIGDKEYPTMSELYRQFEQELENTNYDGEMKGNIRSVLEVRIGSLLRREMKEMFDTSKSMLTPEEWLKRPVIIELESLGEGPANFVTLLLCTLIRETLKSNPLGDKKKPVRHVIFIEEAHNLISSESSADKPEDSNPKIAATAFIVKMLAEVRALKEGIIIADQLPTAMAPEVIKNTNIKLVHRLTSQDDRELVGSTMSASALQLENMATYTKGHALYTYEDLLRPFDMQVERVPEHGEDTPTDQRLYELMMDEKKHPEYVELRKEEEMERWEKIKKSIQKFAGKCEQLTKQLEKVSFENISNNIMSKYIETVNNNCTVLVREKNNLSTQVQSLSDRFISHEKKENALSIIAEAGKSYSKMFDAKIHIWVQE